MNVSHDSEISFNLNRYKWINLIIAVIKNEKLVIVKLSIKSINELLNKKIIERRLIQLIKWLIVCIEFWWSTQRVFSKL